MILFRCTLSHGGVEVPDFLRGLHGLQRVQTEGGDVLTAGDPMFLDPPKDPAAWRNLGTTGVQACIIGDGPELASLTRKRTDVKYISVLDCKGRQWFAPAVLDPEGGCALSISWGMDERGVRVRKPNEEQERLLSAARAARAEVLAGTLDQTPIDVLASWVHVFIESTTHLNGMVVDALELLDDTLAVFYILAATGFPKPQRAALP
jgi:hypothetical protein